MNLPLHLIGQHSQLGGESAPANWQGGFNCTYNYGGPGFKPASQFSNRYYVTCTTFRHSHDSQYKITFFLQKSNLQYKYASQFKKTQFTIQFMN
jgi:hypothetical protein